MRRKTICKRLVSTLIIIFLSVCTLSAGGWRYVVLGEDDGYVELIKDVIAAFPSISSEETLERHFQRLEEEAKVKDQVKRAQYYASDNLSSLSRIEETTVERRSEVEKEEASVNLSSFASFLSLGDKEAYQYLKSSNNLDAIFFVRSEKEGELRNITLYLDGEVIRKAIYLSALKEYEEDALFSLLSPMLSSSEYSSHRIDVTPSSATVTVDGEILSSSSPYVVLKNGVHTFSLSAYGYETMKSVIDTGEVDSIELEAATRDAHSLFVSSSPYDATLFVGGFESESKYISSIHSPFVLTLEKDGFLPKTVQSAKDDSVVDVSLSPSWAGAEGLLEEKKGTFYSSLFTTLLSFGGYVASTTVEKIDSLQIPGVKVVLAGVSIVSLVNTIRSATDYYRLAGL